MSAVLKANGGLRIPAGGVGGDWIVKLPAMRMEAVPENEFARMTLAAEIGIPVPEVRLVAPDEVSGLPEELRNWPDRALGFGGSRKFRPLDDQRTKQFATAAQLAFEAVRLECLETAKRTMDAWARHELRGVLPEQIDETVSTHMESVALGTFRSTATRVRCASDRWGSPPAVCRGQVPAPTPEE